MSNSLGDLTRAGDERFSLRVFSSLKENPSLKMNFIGKRENTFSLMGVTDIESFNYGCRLWWV